MITLAQLQIASLSAGQIRTLVRTGRLLRVHRGVFVIEGSEPTHERAALAAVLACGHGAHLSHVSAAVHWRVLRYPPSLPQVTVPGKTGRRGPAAVDLRHTLNPEPTEHGGIPVTTLPRTLNDIAPTLRPVALEAAVRRAELQHRLDLTTTQARGAPRRFLAGYVSIGGATNELEADFLELCVRHGIPRPHAQFQIGPYFVDFCWPEHRLAIETDGKAGHFGHIARADDAARDEDLARWGWLVLRFTYEEVTRTPDAVAARVRAHL